MAHILFVDDEPAIRETLPKILATHGHTVVAAGSVVDALAYMAAQRFDLLISDLNIGHPSDGFVVVSAMRRIHPECITFILTGYPGFETALQAIRAEVDEYLIKPTDIRKLLETVDQKLKTRAPREKSGNRRLSNALRENISVIIERSQAAMKRDPELGALLIPDSERIEGLADALREVADLMDTGGPVQLGTTAHTVLLHTQGRHPPDLMVRSKRIIEQEVSKVLYENLLSLDLSHLMFDMAQFSDIFMRQLEMSIHSYFESRPPQVGQGVVERTSSPPHAAGEGVGERTVEPRPTYARAEQLEAIIDSAMDAIISIDAQQSVVLFNRAAEQLFGCSAAEAMGKPLDRFLPEKLREIHWQHISRFGAIGVTSRSMRSPATLSAIRSNGEQFPIEATISQAGEGGQKRYTVILRDVTHRVRTERALVHSEKLASLGRLSTTVAHEINNPMEGLKNLLYVIMSNSSDAEEVRKYAEMADAEVSRLADITRQVLGLSRGGDVHSQFHPSEVLETVLPLVNRKFGEKEAVLQKEYRHEAEIWGVASGIRQVFWNLLVNGIDAISRGGLIRVRISRGHNPRDERSGVRITFADNGIGIDAPDLPRLFEPFYTTKSNGNGLGLWVAKQIIDHHSGSIRVRSRTDGSQTGTVFSIFLPTGTRSRTEAALA